MIAYCVSLLLPDGSLDLSERYAARSIDDALDALMLPLDDDDTIIVVDIVTGPDARDLGRARLAEGRHLFMTTMAENPRPPGYRPSFA
jgi:hypothetical protein